MSKGKRILSLFIALTFFISLFIGSPMVSKATTVNLALNKTATASSGTAALAFDGDTNSRWESASSDPQWLSVDLGSSNIVTGVKLNWEVAAGKDYKIQVSADNTTWVDAYTRTGGTGGIENLIFTTPVTGEYVRMSGTARTTTYGYSLYEFEVYGVPVTNTLTSPLITPTNGAYGSTQMVTIVDGTIGAAIKYTTDGSTPTATNGTVYSAAFPVSATSTVSAVAYKLDSICSDVVTSVITIIVPPTNIALNKIADASSNVNTAALAFDNILTTRWGSDTTDPQWISVDLGLRYNITGAKLVWETAAGKDYKIQVSKDNATWIDAYTVTNGASAATLNATFVTAIDGRYVRMFGTTRTTPYGYSLYDFQVYGTATANMVQAPVITTPVGTFTSAQTIAIADADATAQVRYTIDGSYPTISTGILYGAPFSISNTTTVKAVAYKDGMNESGLASSTFIILNPPIGLTISSSISNSASLSWIAVVGAASYNLYRSTSIDGTFTKINTYDLTANGYADIALVGDTTYYYKVSAVNAGVETDLSAAVSVKTPSVSTPDFGPNVYIFDPTMASADIQNISNTVFKKQETNQFGTDRYAFLFKPGSYNNNVNVGFYTSVYGLGQNPDDVNITGSVRVEATWMGGNATCNFWRSVENLAITPTYTATGMPAPGTLTWAVAQAAPMRRVHIKGNLSLWDPKGNWDGAWASGGYISDSIIDGQINSASQQQFFTRNSKMGSWNGSLWNQVFVGDTGTPIANYPTNAVTVIDKSPVIKEKPFLTIGTDAKYSVFVPAVRNDSQGVSWANGDAPGTSISIDNFYIAHPKDSTTVINSALNQGKNLLFTPGIYHLSEALNVKRANTVILGIGMPTLLPENGTAAMKVADVDGVNVAGILFEAGLNNSPVLLEVGQTGSLADHSTNPTTLSDLFFRVGGAFAGKTNSCIQINSNNVIGDHFWVWRADHGAGVSWTDNASKNGVIVNGNNVTMYGLFCEHFNQYNTIWNGNGGRTYFYQNEIAYDVPDQASWMNGTVKGYASYKVADSVTTHEAWGLGIYSYFNQKVDIIDDSAIEAPIKPGVVFHDACTVFLNGSGSILNVINNTGGAVKSGTMRKTITDSTPPIITLVGNLTENVASGATYVDAGATASNSIVGVDITSSIVTTITNNINRLTAFDSSVGGTYTYHYNVMNATGFPAAEVTRTVVVIDTTALSLAIKAAQVLYDAAENGEGKGNKLGLKSKLLEAITDAKAVVTNAATTSQRDIDAAVIALNAVVVKIGKHYSKNYNNEQ